jgi:hypothetical protein
LVWTKDGQGKVIKINYSEQSVTVMFTPDDKRDYHMNDVAANKEDLDIEEALMDLED